MSDKLSIQQRRFAEIYAETNDAVKAYREAYESDQGESAKSLLTTVRHNVNPAKLRELIDEIQQGVRAQFVIMAPDAFKNLVHLAHNAESEKVRLEATKEILHGGGFKPPDEVQLKHVGLFGSVSLDEMREIIRRQIEGVVQEELANNKQNTP